jgi:hypothetical protein
VKLTPHSLRSLLQCYQDRYNILLKDKKKKTVRQRQDTESEAKHLNRENGEIKFMIFDNNYNEVKIGSWVNVLFIDPNFILTFPHDEAKIMKAMINKTYEVIDIEHGKALVNQSFDKYHSFTLELASEEMELVDKN